VTRRERVLAVARRELPALLTGSLCVGIATCNVGRLPAGPTLVAAGVLGLVAMAIARRRAIVLAAALLLLGAGWGAVRMAQLEHSTLARSLGVPAPARAVVTSAPRRSTYGVRAFATVVRYANRSINERALLALPPERAPPRGSIVDLRRAWPVEPRGPQDGFDERRWLARRGVHVVLRASGVEVVGRRGGIGGVADRLRAHVERTIELDTEGERRDLLAGIVLGASERVERGLQDDFRDSGLLHLMAVSGQNVAIVAGGVLAVAWFLGVPLVVLGYALAVGWQPSVVRATVAGLLVSLAWIASRPRDRWHALAIGALVLLAWLPPSVLEPGFQLSFAAVAAIFVVVPRVGRSLAGYPLPLRIAQGAALAIGCTAATAPIVLLHFGHVPVWAVPANVAAEGAMPPLLALTLGAAAVEPVSASAAAALVWLGGWCAAWLAFCARTFAGLPLATVGRLTASVTIAAAVAAAIVWRRLPPYRRRRLLPIALATAVVAAVGAIALRSGADWAPPTGLRVTFLDVGQGDGALLEVPEGAVLVDQGPPEAEVAGQLRRMGIRSLSLVVLTHPQRDHIGGAADVVRRLPVGSILDPSLPAASPEHDAVAEVAERRGVHVVTARAGDAYRLGALRLRILWPDGPGHPGEDPNQRAIVLLVSYGQVDLLLTADAESDVTGRLPLRRVEVLKVAHHGSDDPGLPELLRVLRPDISVVSAGAGNDYGHPRPETIAALEAVPGSRVFRTDVNGRIVVESDGRTLSVRSQR